MPKRKITNNARYTVFFIVVGIFIYNFLNWLVLNFPGLSQESLASRFSEIHFSAAGNDFGWGMFWLNAESLAEPQVITAGWETKVCTKQLRWIYYNAARWARLWPLDNKTLDMLNDGNGYSSLNVTGGLFTSCGSDSYWIFGHIKYSHWWVDSHIIAGVKLNYASNGFSASFANSFEYFNNITPLGYVWDSVWGIWFVWGILDWSENLINNLNNWSNINDSFAFSGDTIISNNPWWILNSSGSSQAQDTMRNILIQGNTFISTAISSEEKKTLLGNIEKKTVLMVSDLNASDVINKAKKNAATLCRGKNYFVESAGVAKLPNSYKDKIICYKDTKNLEIDLSQELHKDKTIIMQNWNITLKNSMNSDSSPLDIFIDGWILAINNIGSEKIWFDWNGYPSTSDIKNHWTLIKGNLVINWLLVGWEPNNIETIKHKVHLLGKIVFLNTPTNPSSGRITQVTNTLNSDAYSNRIWLENVFSWYCNLQGTGSDNTICGWGNSTITIVPFVVLNENYPSNIIR